MRICITFIIYWWMQSGSLNWQFFGVSVTTSHSCIYCWIKESQGVSLGHGLQWEEAVVSLAEGQGALSGTASAAEWRVRLQFEELKWSSSLSLSVKVESLYSLRFKPSLWLVSIWEDLLYLQPCNWHSKRYTNSTDKPTYGCTHRDFKA